MPDTYRQHLDSDEFSDVGELLDLLDLRPAFHADAACKEAPLSVTWFPTKSGSGRTAKRVCAGCLARDECRAWSLEQGPELDGIWAGMDRRDRAAVRAGKRAAA